MKMFADHHHIIRSNFKIRPELQAKVSYQIINRNTFYWTINIDLFHINVKLCVVIFSFLFHS